MCWWGGLWPGRSVGPPRCALTSPTAAATTTQRAVRTTTLKEMEGERGRRVAMMTMGTRRVRETVRGMRVSRARVGQVGVERKKGRRVGS